MVTKKAISNLLRPILELVVVLLWGRGQKSEVDPMTTPAVHIQTSCQNSGVGGFGALPLFLIFLVFLKWQVDPRGRRIKRLLMELFEQIEQSRMR
ncbi:hypothetical protein Dfer_5503 [Dyadobacter fermentans DSM 18053]|uniref:Uncharacterized protein n=1 Tax=Dyadobacter fermentans (strain ATCC 700827 / DSM 18053 / CIP 107007 / KCTC 52180 / NS114) TaxID=471854 RepID=C6VVG4_DYAFD|nr:hypothetical protein Dfer_5503 [Dyadobacter fermentans DSM 18053]